VISASTFRPVREGERYHYAPGIPNAVYLDGFYRRMTDTDWAAFRAAARVGLLPHVAVEPGRNDPCPCSSGAKFKRCCGS
jgi:hypothetical protein